MLQKIRSKLFIFQLKYIKNYGPRNFITETPAVETENNENLIKSKHPKPNKKQLTEIKAYLSTIDSMVNVGDSIPTRFLKRNHKYPDDLYLIDAKVAKQIVSKIKPYIANDNESVIETNPGFGYITKNLLDAGLQKMHVYEATVYFRNWILILDTQYPQRLKVYNKDFFSIWSLSYQDCHDNGDRVKRMLSHIETKNWTDNVAMTIVGALATSNFIRHVMLSLIFQFGVMTHGRCELFLTLPPPLYLQLTATSERGLVRYRASSVLFQLLCDSTILDKVPRKSFLPWDNTHTVKSKLKYKHLHNPEPENLYLTRIVFKKKLPVPQNKLQHLWYFIQYMMISRKRKIIPTLESWIPGCGISLQLQNNPKFFNKSNNFPKLNIYTKSGELTPEELLAVFIHFSNLPEYNESPFIASMESALLKMESMNYSETVLSEGEDNDTGTEAKKTESDER